MECLTCGTTLTGIKRKWCSEKCRQQRYHGTCEQCGGPTNGKDGPAPKVCIKCLSWTKDGVIEALRNYPRKPTMSNTPVHPRIVERHWRSWNVALTLAGWKPSMYRDRDVDAILIRAVQRGIPTYLLEHVFDIDADAIRVRLQQQGYSVGRIKRDYPIRGA